ncbi:MAG TPA: XrtA-associated tyrosine autokinase, partial [Ideonella sp.]|nr:XrtA-associated tyrosine autokinase [Ideonella sp.]
AAGRSVGRQPGPADGVALPPAANTPLRAPELPARHSAEVTLDLDRLRQAGHLVPALARSGLAEEFRNIKRPLLKNAQEATPPGAHPRSLIMVSSALPGEGKTFCSINLAMSIAMEVDSSVLLVDADVVRPALFARLGLSNERKGLLDILTEPDLDMSEVLLKTNVPKLSLLGTGTLNAKSTELLASVAMGQLLEELAARYPDRIVIFDAPPLLLTTEARVLASHVGQVVMVIEASNTALRDVKQAFAAIEKCPIVLSVLNKCRDPFEKSAYGYYY